MAPTTVPRDIPPTAIAGDSLVWDEPEVTDPRGPFTAADGWSLSYDFSSEGGSLSVAGAYLSTGWRFTLTPAQTLALKVAADVTAEKVTWQQSAAKSGERYTVRYGRLMLLPDLKTLGPALSYNKKLLAAIEATLAGRATSDMESYHIHGRSLNHIPFADLMKFRGVVQAAVDAENSEGEYGRGVELHFQAVR